jgi:hypothetical protein
MMLSLVSSVSAITVDGNKTSGEWNDNWAFNQTNNVTAASEYDPDNLGDRLEIRQGAFGIQPDTETWYAEDPKNDSGTNFDQTMAQRGESSGMDIERIYGHYDPVNDTIYGMSTVYGIPGDLDGDGNVSQDCSNFGDCIGNPGPAGEGIGGAEEWLIRMSQPDEPGTDTVQISVANNNWTVEQGPIDYEDIEASFSPTENGVYEIAITDASEFLDISPCANPVKIEVSAGGTRDAPGEDRATAFIDVPCPDIEITKYVSKDNSTWLDADTQSAGPTYINESGEPVYWKYEIENTGDEPLTNVVIEDDKLGTIANIGNLGNETGNNTAVAYAESTVPDPCEDYRNVGTVEGVGIVSGVTVTADDPAHYNCGEKPPNGVPALTPTSLMGLIGALGLIGIVGLKRRD